MTPKSHFVSWAFPLPARDTFRFGIILWVLVIWGKLTHCHGRGRGRGLRERIDAFIHTLYERFLVWMKVVALLFIYNIITRGCTLYWDNVMRMRDKLY